MWIMHLAEEIRRVVAQRPHGSPPAEAIRSVPT
jgi:hypothetical protein